MLSKEVERIVAPTLTKRIENSTNRLNRMGRNSNTFGGKIRLGLSAFLIMISIFYLLNLVEVLNNLPDYSRVKDDDEVIYMGQNLNLARGKIEGIGKTGFTELIQFKRQHREKYSSNHNTSNNNHSKNNTARHQQERQAPTFNVQRDNDGIPRGIWPIPSTIMNNSASTKYNNSNEFEIIIHPGDKETKMLVPKLWSLPIHRNKLMTNELAMKVGTCIKPDNGNFVRGESCPVNDRTINVAIASYRDFQCRYTVESIFLRAKYPQRIRVTVVDQIIADEDPHCGIPIEPCETNPKQALCIYNNQIDVFTMDAKLGIGPVFARHIGNRMYRGEYYTTQSDAHVTYVQDWDIDIISQLEATENEMAVLSTYLTDIQGSIDEKTGKSKRKTRPIMCNTRYEGGSGGNHLRHGSQPEARPAIRGVPTLQPWWAAGYSFSRGHFIVNVPYDAYQPFVFQGEEMSIGLRGFTIGYDYYAPERSVCFHHYAVGNNAKVRGKVKHFWENRNAYPNEKQLEVKSMARLLGIVHMNPEVEKSFWDHTEENIYGIGKLREPEQFYQIFGIDVVKKTVENHLCKYVNLGAKMHKDFIPHLRPKEIGTSKSMGIDYSNITFRFKDPAPNEKVYN